MTEWTWKRVQGAGWFLQENGTPVLYCTRGGVPAEETRDWLANKLTANDALLAAAKACLKEIETSKAEKLSNGFTYVAVYLKPEQVADLRAAIALAEGQS